MLTFVVALHCEAKPVIDFYKLKKVDVKPFDLYRGKSESVEIELLVTGIGALSVASAVAWLAGANTSINKAQRVWLNVGTAGHEDRDVGSLILVHGVGDEVLQRSHYPPLVCKWAGQTDAVLSVSAPTSSYPAGAAVDMEAYAFFNTAIRFSDSELVQSLKVISDNREQGIESLNAKKMTLLISNHIADIHQFSLNLLAVSPKPMVVDYQVLECLSGTHSQQQQAKEALLKINASGDTHDVESLRQSLRGLTRLKDALQLLRSTLDSITPSINALARSKSVKSNG